ncbi:hypothetical protein F3Y22_tig00117048pilonHSYRG01282 [Hibiscus syriacus]|uniref:Uncharacterized protein n=1 Tax=Hibiscus syriacus TaxID=106335 RepID=A0A6A2X8A7_HIBSY|nr:hypothetical protein F3Y22_tig00117048pilonHSYRG01282 [Hibiscus syriacus]
MMKSCQLTFELVALLSWTFELARDFISAGELHHHLHHTEYYKYGLAQLQLKLMGSSSNDERHMFDAKSLLSCCSSSRHGGVHALSILHHPYYLSIQGVAFGVSPRSGNNKVANFSIIEEACYQDNHLAYHGLQDIILWLQPHQSLARRPMCIQPKLINSRTSVLVNPRSGHNKAIYSLPSKRVDSPYIKMERIEMDRIVIKEGLRKCCRMILQVMMDSASNGGDGRMPCVIMVMDYGDDIGVIMVMNRLCPWPNGLLALHLGANFESEGCLGRIERTLFNLAPISSTCMAHVWDGHEALTWVAWGLMVCLLLGVKLNSNLGVTLHPTCF